MRTTAIPRLPLGQLPACCIDCARQQGSANGNLQLRIFWHRRNQALDQVQLVPWGPVVYLAARHMRHAPCEGSVLVPNYVLTKAMYLLGVHKP